MISCHQLLVDDEKKSKQAFNVEFRLLFSFLAFITNQSCETALFGLVALKFSLIRIT